MCKGSGEVQPVISVEWKPAGYVKPEFQNKKLTIEDMPKHPKVSPRMK
jgi:hypothetical protein